MTLTTTRASELVPHDNPCAQCGKPISKPIWTEPGDGCVTYVWACQACDYEFTSTAIFGVHRQEESLAA